MMFVYLFKIIGDMNPKIKTTNNLCENNKHFTIN